MAKRTEQRTQRLAIRITTPQRRNRRLAVRADRGRSVPLLACCARCAAGAVRRLGRAPSARCAVSARQTQRRTCATHPFLCEPFAPARLAASWPTRFVDAILRGCAFLDGPPSADGGVEAFETLYGSGDAFELDPTPFPHPSLEGLGWKSVWSRGRIWCGSTVNEFGFPPMA